MDDELEEEEEEDGGEGERILIILNSKYNVLYKNKTIIFE